MKAGQRTRRGILGAGIVAAVLVFCSALYFFEPTRALYETASIAIFPSASRAMTYGDRHFSSKNGSAYNIELAGYFYRIAAKLDPDTPYVMHQLARTAFLSAKNNEALVFINIQIDKTGDSFPNAYYVRGLIEGFMGDYTNSISDYKKYLEHDPTNWAATNDLSWVLLKANRPKEVLAVIDKVLPYAPKNAWLLNSYAIALHEMGRDYEAKKYALEAAKSVQDVTEADWLRAYPGNDPAIAAEGVRALKDAVATNIHNIELALQKAKKTVR